MKSDGPSSPRASWKPRTIYLLQEARRDWSWQPKRAAMQLREEQRRKTEETKETST